ncbi:hypothetical protein NDU88_000882 [Pleurodeles waltl]|uniref:G-protein coupled receptors family 1 profile domain-containing protein n=1 Tax=Pleurodeles waltl TaxID=8319 RepID=A0AAV7P262_PLEWA|nr:hypothetical protein NDU88_000882 [Pleurodeles waltl]
MIATSSSFYFTSCLSAFYTFKISSFGLPWLFSLRRKAPISMPYILLLLLLVSSIISVPTTMFIKLKAANGSDLHCGDYYELSKAFGAYSLTFTILAYMVPLAVLTICSVLLIVSLCHHSRRMGSGTRAAVHRRVAKMMLVLLVFYALCVVFGQVSIQLYTEGGGISDWFVTSCFVVLAYSSGCPFVVTWGTVRLHQRLLEI